MNALLCNDEKWLLSEEAYGIYSACMYKPTFDAYCKEMKGLLSDKKIYVCKVDATIKGMIVLDKEKAEIVGIAIDPNFRKKGIGRYLVEEVMRQEDLKSLYAQTDDDAVLFYQKCGFEVKRIIKEYPDGKVVRYDCTKKLGE
ncbi:MAG: GNAT family N-acetyltransferase [Clostridiales bacterium]|nr:GNAT family N-acetyltransferase [Clostridiales bacterium]